MSLSTGPKFYPSLDCSVYTFSLYFIIGISFEFFKSSEQCPFAVESVHTLVHIVQIQRMWEYSKIKHIIFSIHLLIANFLVFFWFKQYLIIRLEWYKYLTAILLSDQYKMVIFESSLYHLPFFLFHKNENKQLIMIGMEATMAFW